MQYIKFKLTHGQQPPKGASGIVLLDSDWIVWEAEEEEVFNPFSKFGFIGDKDPEPSSKIKSEIMTEEEIQEYKDILAGKYDDI